MIFTMLDKEHTHLPIYDGETDAEELFDKVKEYEDTYHTGRNFFFPGAYTAFMYEAISMAFVMDACVVIEDMPDKVWNTLLGRWRDASIFHMIFAALDVGTSDVARERYLKEFFWKDEEWSRKRARTLAQSN